jgi:hypothetical protein
MASRKKAPAKKKKTAKKAVKKAAPAKKKAAGKKSAPKKKKSAAKKSSAKKSSAKKSSAEKSSAKKSQKKKKKAAAPAKSTRAKKAKAKIAPRPQRGARPAKPARVRAGASLATGREPPRRKRETTLPPGHETLEMGPLKGEPAEKNMVIEAVRAALQAVEEHPIKGRAVLGRRNLVDLPQEGDLDYAIAQEAQRAVQEVLAADETAREEQREVDERIAQVYSSEAQELAKDDEEQSS